MITKPIVIIHIFMLIGLLVLPGTALADGSESGLVNSRESREVEMPATLNPGLNHILDMVAPGNRVAFNTQAVVPVLDFIASAKSENDIYVSDNSFNSPSAYIEFDIKNGMADLLRLSYNPDIPSNLMTPSSIRLGYWKEIREGEKSFANLWEQLPDLKDPIVIRGVETVENTPDIHTGAYYKYDLERTMVLFEHQGKKVFLSLSRQIGNSMVGKKGVVLGEDEDWNYLYSGEKGINKFGLGWVDSYMYASSSIIVYYQTDPGKPQLRCAVFKWLRAGWKNLNMVKNHHIYKGMQRWATDYKSIVEHPAFPSAGDLTEACSRIERIGLAELKRINHLYYQSLEKRYAEDKSVSSKWASKVLRDDSRVEVSDVHELRSVVVVEYLKSVLGKRHSIDVASIIGLDTEPLQLSKN